MPQILVCNLKKKTTIRVGVPKGITDLYSHIRSNNSEMLDDPKTKQKHTNKPLSNNKTSNIKFPTSNSAITLIALIITIIVLLILAGVILSMVLGENGIIGKANKAKSKTEIAQYQEELQMCVTEIQADEAEQGRTITLEKIQELLPSKAKTLYNITDDEISINAIQQTDELTGVYKGYGFKINNKYVVTIKEPVSQTEESYITMEIKKPEGVKEYTNQNVNILITIHNPVGIKQITTEDGTIIEGNGEKEVSKDYENVEVNTTYTYEIENINGKKETKVYKVTCIDKLEPKDFEIKGELTEEGTLTITAKTEDAEATDEYACSGIDKYEYHIIDENNREEIYTSNVINNLPVTKYTVYAIAYDRAGNMKQTDTISIKVTRKFKDIEAGEYATWAIDEKGNLWCGGNPTYGNPVDGGTLKTSFKKILEGINKISSGRYNDDHILALDKDNNLYAWGHNTSGQIGNGIAQNANFGLTRIKNNEVKFKRISIGYDTSRAIDEIGNIWSWGGSYLGNGTSTRSTKPIILDVDTKFKQIEVGGNTTTNWTIAIDTEGNLWSWGSNSFDTLGIEGVNENKKPEKIDTKQIRFKAISCGVDHNLALDIDGNIWSWGYSSHGDLGLETNNNDRISTPMQVNTNEVKFKEISAGQSFSLAIDMEGNIWSCGYNNYGQLGNGSQRDVKKFTKIETDSIKGIKFKKVSAGSTNSVALDEEGNIWTCGNGTNGQLLSGQSTHKTFIKIEL